MADVIFKQKPQGHILSEYMQSMSRVSFIMGPLGSGKTFQSCQKIFSLMCQQEPNSIGVRPTRFIAVRNTSSELKTTTIKDWLEIYGCLDGYKGGRDEPPSQTLDFMLEDGTNVQSQLIFLALDRPDSVKKLRGVQATGFWLNETKEINKSVVDMADLRHGRYPSIAAGGVRPSWHGMIGDTNAPDEDHWYYKLAEEVRPPDWRFFRQPGGLIKQGDSYHSNDKAENISNLPDGYYTNGVAGKSKDWIDVNLCNEYGYVATGKPVYPEYVDSVHCMADDYEPDPSFPIIIGVDFGRTPACAFLQFIPGIGRYIGFDEFVTSNMSAALFAPELRRYIDQNYANFSFDVGGGDPSGDYKGEAVELVPFKILAKHDIIIQPTHTNNPLIRRASIVNSLTRLCMDGKPAFMLSPKCKVWRKGLAGGFCFKRKLIAGDDKYLDVPVKNDFRLICEAGEYGIMAGGEGRKAVARSDSHFNSPVVAPVSVDLF